MTAKPKAVRWNLRLDEDTAALLDKLSELDGEAQAVVVRRLIREEAERRGIKP